MLWMICWPAIAIVLLLVVVVQANANCNHVRRYQRLASLLTRQRRRRFPRPKFWRAAVDTPTPRPDRTVVPLGWDFGDDDAA